MKAVLLGSLGALTDLTTLERHAFNNTFAEAGLDLFWSQDQYQAILKEHGRYGGPTVLVAQLGADIAQLADRLEHHFREAIDSAELSLRPGLEASLLDARRQRLRPAFVSGAERQTVLRVLAALFGSRASTVFDAVICADCGAPAKPAPDLYDVALDAIGTTADQAFAYETTADGIAAARSAGLFTFAVPGQVKIAEDLSSADATASTTLREDLATCVAWDLRHRPGGPALAGQLPKALAGRYVPAAQ
ncbi:phosphatase [Jannaschia pagri]|uniref:Phosphatase n=1 Tax=Jannaschia pagri TaxID=2829797 RepID=A0ABQ4NR10_9RHOB|nr:MULTISPECIES: HAD family hydrolase [unclassified Jannaschia]GIT93013.1 phosphatase [Jannaschia sp. AI_61]GIT96848.1 phosphatase [Jannaschia sp. AI_62]